MSYLLKTTIVLFSLSLFSLGARQILAQDNNTNGFSTYENHRYRIHIEYPSDWNTLEPAPTPNNTSVIVYLVSPTNSSFVNIVFENLTRKSLSLTNYTESALSYLSKSIPGFDSGSIIKNSTTIGSVSAEKIQYRIKDPLTTNYYNVTEAVLLNGSKAYIITNVSPQSQYHKDFPDVERMINSFRLLPPEVTTSQSSLFFLFLPIIIIILGVFSLFIYLIIKRLRKWTKNRGLHQ